MTTRGAAQSREGRFDAFRLSRDGGVIEGTVDAATLPRLADRVTSEPAPVHWRIRGAKDGLGRPALQVEIDGMVPLECQRCLEELEQDVVQHTELLLAATEPELARLDAESDAEVLLADAPLDPLVLIEDELVLALPFAPRHPDGECELKQ